MGSGCCVSCGKVGKKEKRKEENVEILKLIFTPLCTVSESGFD